MGTCHALLFNASRRDVGTPHGDDRDGPFEIESLSVSTSCAWAHPQSSSFVHLPHHLPATLAISTYCTRQTPITMPSSEKNGKSSTKQPKSHRLIRSLKVLIQAVKPRPFKLSASHASRKSRPKALAPATPPTPPTPSQVSEEARSDFATFASSVRATRRAQYAQEHEDETPICEGDCVIPKKRKMVIVPLEMCIVSDSSSASQCLGPPREDVGTVADPLPEQCQEHISTEVSPPSDMHTGSCSLTICRLLRILSRILPRVNRFPPQMTCPINRRLQALITRMRFRRLQLLPYHHYATLSCCQTPYSLYLQSFFRLKSPPTILLECHLRSSKTLVLLSIKRTCKTLK